MTIPFEVRPFGRDCMGNITGYSVERYVWRPRPWSGRADGLCLEREVAESFVGDIYKPGSYKLARKQADRLARRINSHLTH